MNFEEIMTRLRNGESMETIAQEMEDMLNKANAEIQEQAKRDEKEIKLNALAENLAATLTEYLDLVCPDCDLQISGADMREGLDEMMPLFELFKTLNTKAASIPTPKADKKPAGSPEDVFAKFFQSLGI